MVPTFTVPQLFAFGTVRSKRDESLSIIPSCIILFLFLLNCCWLIHGAPT